MKLLQINQSEENSKITINAHTTSCPLHQLPITTASTLLFVSYLCSSLENIFHHMSSVHIWWNSGSSSSSESNLLHLHIFPHKTLHNPLILSATLIFYYGSIQNYHFRYLGYSDNIQTISSIIYACLFMLISFLKLLEGDCTYYLLEALFVNVMANFL